MLDWSGAGRGDPMFDLASLTLGPWSKRRLRKRSCGVPFR
ncbi:hypothetical protein [Actinoplanes sp. NPDC051859]